MKGIAIFDFTDKVVIVTGARGNLGSAEARAYLAAGAQLVMPDHQRDRLTALFPEFAQSVDPKSRDHLLVEHIDLTNPQTRICL
jgi:NAD(P)-dependent dehydrogenase (short-subunit alcohol dehydrogenase family)